MSKPAGASSGAVRSARRSAGGLVSVHAIAGGAAPVHAIAGGPTALDAVAGLAEARLIAQPAGAVVVPIHLLRFAPGRFDPRNFAQLGLLCPPDIARSVPQRQAEFFFGRLAARLALSDAGWHGAQVGRGKHRQPLWPAGVVGAITHNNGVAAACAVPAHALHGVGIDIESVPDADTAAAVETQVLSAAELRMLRDDGTRAYRLLLAIAFSAKESLYKALSPVVGRYFGFDALRIERIDPLDPLDPLDMAAGRLHYTLLQTLAPAWPAGRTGQMDFTMLDAHTVLTVCAW